MFLSAEKSTENIIFLTIIYNTGETGHIESSVLLSLSASCSHYVNISVLNSHPDGHSPEENFLKVDLQ